MLAAVVVVEWLLLAAGTGTFLALYGRPWRYRDREMSWHLWAVTVVAFFGPIGLLAAGVSLVPTAVVEGAAVGLAWWRVVLLVQTRRRTRRAGHASGRTQPPSGPRT